MTWKRFLYYWPFVRGIQRSPGVYASVHWVIFGQCTVKSLISAHLILDFKYLLSLFFICLCPIHWSQVLRREWRWSWSNADRRCSNYIWVIDNFIAYYGATYIRGFTVDVIACHLFSANPLPESVIIDCKKGTLSCGTCVSKIKSKYIDILSRTCI